MNVYYSTPFMRGNIGGGLNEFCRLVPDDAWICLRDADTLFLTSKQQFQIEDIANSDPCFDLIGCLTNRLRAHYQLHAGAFSEEPDIRRHIAIAENRETRYWGDVQRVDRTVAGMFMLFRKRTWRAVGGFAENSIQFDMDFSQRVIAHGGSTGIAQGIYLFHLYRFGKADPFNSIEHLL